MSQTRTDTAVTSHCGLLIAVLIASLLIGCSGVPIHSQSGTTHYVILGLGVVSLREQKGVSVTDGGALGLIAGRSGLTAGIGQQHDVRIDPTMASNVVISISATPFSLTVTNFDPYWTNGARWGQQKKGSTYDE